ncbi:electron transport complex subunit RsxC [Exilibacterium tricleocarpae]|uniref:Ion-translocating oxidoreductase complex subunit C n=2 Tax=Exilibacterium tricleocarpae TaxID=2591008 RepID=A0A545UA26_9GAMM|nr:electron transport complex subunit RsxC [Exilibacterium tricleocarpae]
MAGHFVHRDPSFAHGVHPPMSKEQTRGLAIRQFPFAPVMNIPLAQHIGEAAVPVVREGQEVERGQLLAEPGGFVSVAMHAPASGLIQRIGLMPSIAGKMVTGIYLKPFPGSTQEVSSGTPCDLDSATADEIITAIQRAGIVGLGGAAFPTHVKLKVPAGHSVDTLILNGVECEPYLTTDYRVMLEQRHDIFTGIGYLLKATGARRAIIGIEANKQDAATALRAALPRGHHVSVELLEVKYPQGAEKLLIKALLNRDVPSGGLPADVQAVVVNVATAAEVGRLLPLGRGIQERVITIAGPAIKKPGNYRIPVGTPLRFALDYVGVEKDLSQVFLGGPMMGAALPSLDIPITKGTSGFVAFTERETGGRRRESPCIRCAYCVDACPLFLNPSQLGLLARNEQYETMVEKFHLMDCFECGACSYVCPSHIPLVQYFRAAKVMAKKRRGKP